jgi:predicted DNA-binding protein
MAKEPLTEVLMIRISKQDRERLDMLCETHGVSRAGVIRMLIRASIIKLGLEAKRRRKKGPK